MKTADRSLQARFERLLDRLFAGTLLPFIGAGFSLAARLPDDDSFEPTVGYLCGLIKDRLARHLETPFSTDSVEREAVRALIAQMGNSLDKVADMAGWLLGHPEVCEAARIAEYARLIPLPSHRYLAYLAREGLVGEVISTNYDCCVEAAFKASFGPEAERMGERLPIKVVKDLGGYRQFGGYVEERDGQQRPVLRLYKINGCADAYRTDRSYALEARLERLIDWNAVAVHRARF